MVIYLDGADWHQMEAWHGKVSGFTTNPTLARRAGVTDYKYFCERVISVAQGKPISLEVFADDEMEMERQAHKLSSWGENVYVKIPVTNTKGESTGTLVNRLGLAGVKVNVTAVTTFEQIRSMTRHIWVGTPAILSIFAGRIADTGRNPVPFFTAATAVKHDKTKILWASAREVLNVKQAEQAGADIITLTPDLIKKMELFGKDLNQYSLETVKMFHNDAKEAGFQL